MTDWQARYESNDTPWDKGAAAPPLLELLMERPFHGHVLVLGCGFGHDVRAISTSENKVVGLDLAEAAVEGARKFPATGNESYATGNLFNLPGSMLGTFDVVFEHTCFCAIDPSDRERYVQAVRSALKPGGELSAIFYLDPDHEPGPPFPVTEDELDALFGTHFELLEKRKPKSNFPGREGCEQVRNYRLRVTAAE